MIRLVMRSVCSLKMGNLQCKLRKGFAVTLCVVGYNVYHNQAMQFALAHASRFRRKSNCKQNRLRSDCSQASVQACKLWVFIRIIQ